MSAVLGTVLTNLPNILLAGDMIDSLLARLQSVRAGMKQAVAEGRDLTDDELAAFRQGALDADTELGKAIARKAERENAASAAAASAAQAASGVAKS